MVGIFIPLREVEFVKRPHGGVAPAGILKIVNHRFLAPTVKCQVEGKTYICNNSERLKVEILRRYSDVASSAQRKQIDDRIK